MKHNRQIDPMHADKCSVTIDWRNIVRMMRDHTTCYKYAESVTGTTDNGVDIAVTVRVINLPESVHDDLG